ncbi:hypothetical protein KUH03_28400 [Sphingobacterium sp. E70]|uniref:hypothetical protein n=1 Tax=Sphingobacterium sp. E70 TaxID=2853439 RepID=UPI00211CC096|nr:hypothetical protein [Sphingobacterium sp. E70]ULT23128.1 hypothetical protein KUH03_28400 [Sphingobacterium sp. E70]
MIFYFRENTAEPNEIKDAFLRFLKEYKVKGRIEKQYHVGDLKKESSILPFIIQSCTKC